MMSDMERQFLLQQFYFKEARFLDARQYKQWLELVHPDIRYCVPSRGNPLVHGADRGLEEMLSVERELEGLGGDGVPVREEGYFMLQIRVERAYKLNSWAEQPPACTRRLVSNIETQYVDEQAATMDVISNFLLYYSREETEVVYAGQRRDILLNEEGGLRIAKRTVILDSHLITKPTLGLLF